MEKRDIEKQLNTAIQHAMSDDLREKVLKRCNEERVGTPLVINNVVDRKSKRNERIMSIVAAVAVIFLACNILFNLYEDSIKNKVDYVVDIDVNPSIELQINSKDRVVDVKPINTDAEDILDGMELKGTQTKVAVNAIIGAMFEHGYLRGDTSKLLVSVDAKNSSDSEDVQKAITEDINKILESYSSEASAIGQSISEDDSIAEIAQNYGISNGKAALIQKIIACDSSYSIEELSKLNITELYAIIRKINGLSVCNGEIVNGSDLVDATAEDEQAINNTAGGTIVMESGASIFNIDANSTKDDNNSNNKANKEKDKKKDKDKNKNKDDKPDTVSDNSVDNSKPENGGSDDSNAASDNAASENAASENSASENSASSNSASDNSASSNSASENSASDNTASDNRPIDVLDTNFVK